MRAANLVIAFEQRGCASLVRKPGSPAVCSMVRTAIHDKAMDCQHQMSLELDALAILEGILEYEGEVTAPFLMQAIQCLNALSQKLPLRAPVRLRMTTINGDFCCLQSCWWPGGQSLS